LHKIEWKSMMNMMTEIWIAIALGVITIAELVYITYLKGRISSISGSQVVQSKRLELLEQELAQERLLLHRAQTEKESWMQRSAQMEASYEALRERLVAQNQDRDALLLKFKDLSAQVIEERAERFNQEQTDSLDVLLRPLADRISRFEKQVAESGRQAIERHVQLREQVRQLTAINSTMGEEARRLTNALKADVKQQGAWSEMILESILEKSGLKKGREYTVQDAHIDREGKRLRTDVIISLPDQKKIIIDSKVSLKDFERLANSESEAERDIALRAHGLSIKNHVDILSSKNYHDLYQVESPDFVLMFVPKDNAFAAALNYDQNLYQYAFDKNIVIVTPATLLATLKTIDTMWKNHYQNSYALEIASEAGKMYDKFVGLSDDLLKVGKQLSTVSNTYNDCMTKLKTGKGNLIGRAERLKELGAKANKKVDESLLLQ